MENTQMLHPQKTPLNPTKKATSSFMYTESITQYFYRFFVLHHERVFFDVDTKKADFRLHRMPKDDKNVFPLQFETDH
jgi:hypothetical protein